MATWFTEVPHPFVGPMGQAPSLRGIAEGVAGADGGPVCQRLAQTLAARAHTESVSYCDGGWRLLLGAEGDRRSTF